MGLPILPETAPFPAEHIEVLNAVMAHASAEQRHWLSGFLAGYHAALVSPAALPAAPAAEPRRKVPLTVLYGTDSGNAEGVADAAKKAAAKSGFAARIVDMADTAPAEMAKAEHLLVITSTWGEGDPPERAASFYQALMAENAPRFDGVPFSVLALGDSSYVNFCETGRQIDARLETLGGKRIAPRVDCDLDYEEPAAAWTKGALKELADLAEPEPAAKGPALAAVRGEVIHFPSALAEPLYGKANPFPAEITELVNLNGSRSGKQTIHLELSLEGSGLSFEPGDSLGIVTENRPETVEAVLQAAGLAGDVGLAARLAREWDVTTLSRQVLEAYAALNPAPALAELIAGDGWRGYVPGRQLLDLLEDFPLALTPEQLTGLLRKLPPRLYSVASSQKAAPDEAHLLVGVVRYQSHGRERHGVASTFVAERLRAGDKLKVYVKPNRNFRLPGRPRPPDDHDRPGHRRGTVPGLSAGAPGHGRQGPQLAVLRRSQLHPRLPLPARVAGPAQGRRAERARRGLLARPAGEGLRAAPDVAAARGAVRLARGRRASLRLRRREGDGQGRARDARGDRRGPGPAPGRGRRGLPRRPEEAAPLPARRLLSPRAKEPS